VFQKPLSVRSGPFPGSLCSTEQVGYLFANAERIYTVSNDVLRSLEAEINVPIQRQRISRIFLEFARHLKLYEEYVNNYERALATLETLKKKDAFAQWLESTEAKTECAGHNLYDFLVTPIQRIPRYELLLRELINYTDESHVDYQGLGAALQSMKDVGEYLNESKRRAENMAKIRQLSEQLHGRLPFTLIEPQRRFIREGVLSVREDSGTPNPRVLLLFNDILIIASRRLFILNELVYKSHFQLYRTIARDIASTGM